MDEDLPIDIHYNKLLDWLISRRHCSNNWQDDAMKIRKLINIAIQDMPPVTEIIDILRGNYINYFHCCRIVELLKDCEGGSKTLFGSYSSKRINDWIEIVKNYEKSNIHLAETAQLLARYVNFEIPALKRQIAKLIQLQQDYARKEVDNGKSSTELLEKFKSSCQQYGIEGKNVHQEISLLVTNLTPLLNEIMDNIPALNEPMQYYQDFVNFLSSSPKGVLLPMAQYLLKKGNTTVFEWMHGEAPSRVEEDVLKYCTDVQDIVPDEIDWTIIDAQTEIKEEIDFGDDLDIKIIEDSNDVVDINLNTDKVARGKEAFLLLEHFPTRESFLNDMYELEAFLKQRLLDLSSRKEDNFLTTFIFENAPRSLHRNASQVEDMLSKVLVVIDAFKQPFIRDLLLIRSFPRHIDRIGSSLKKLRSDSEKMESMSRLMAVRSEETTIELIKMEPQLKTLIVNTKQLQQQISGEISKKYKNRRVNIMGEINLI